MDKVGKALKKLSAREQTLVKEILKKIDSNDLRGLDIKKLKGGKNIFRARKGTIRIIYQIKEENIFILAIERRSEKTYKKL